MSSLRSTPAPTASIDIVELQRRFADDWVLIREVARTFLDALPTLWAEVMQASDRAELAALQRAVHQLRGALLDVGALQAAELARQIELAGVARQQSLPSLLTLVEEAARDVEVLLASP